jgi:FkbM family methyltransferase
MEVCRENFRSKRAAWMAEIRRVCRIVFVERRIPVRCYHLYFSFLNRLGIRLATINLKNGLTVKGYTHCLFMFYEVWSKKDYDIPGFTLARNMTVIDIGANQGFFSLYAASLGATVYAFEPCVDSFKILQWNVSKNGLEGCVKMFNAAVTNKQGKVDLFVGLDTSGEVLLATASTSEENAGAAGVQTRSVESVTLDSLLGDLHIEKCDFLKIDCEGAEYEILASTSQESFSKIARIAVECHGNRMQEAVTILKNTGFEIVYERLGYLGFLKATNTRLAI